jgi:hypothetical protein
MFNSNNQVIFDEIYDENIQPTDDEIAEYASFIGIDPEEVNHLKRSNALISF